jgi:hypothetical protein
MPCPQLADVLLAEKLDLCYFVGFRCSHHGAVRAVLNTEPPRRHPCPVCAQTCRCKLMALGGTRSAVPAFWRCLPTRLTERWAAVPTQQLDAATGRFQASVGIG